MSTIQLLITDDANRRALKSVVKTRYTPIAEGEIRDADLYLVDDMSLPTYQKALETHKRERSPVFCPVILIRREQTPIDINLAEPDPGNRPLVVNEVVDAPIAKQLLFRRIGNLLIRRQQTTELHEANERLEQFAGTLRHELRNPLNILDGYLDIARDTGEEVTFDRCQQAVDRMDRLLEDTLLTLKGGDPQLDRTWTDLAHLCRECWNLVAEADMRLKIETTHSLYADGDRLRQLLGNLFRNANEHGGDGVTVTVGELDGGFYVTDDGTGIPKAEHDRVFEEGYTTNEAGSGLGLAVVKAVTDAHGWTIAVANERHGGARFEITDVELR